MDLQMHLVADGIGDVETEEMDRKKGERLVRRGVVCSVLGEERVGMVGIGEVVRWWVDWTLNSYR